jgi:predicted ArsR family transcriptional regulator
MTVSDIEAIALREEPARRALYDAVVAADRPIGRDEAATAAGVTRALAAFHLDRLVDGGLLGTEFRRLSGRTGPGAGRPSKLYRRADRDVAVQLPARSYAVSAEVLATAIEHMTGRNPSEAVHEAAHDLGAKVGAEARREAGPRPSAGKLRAALLATLERRGYEPIAAANGQTFLRNCPFHALVDEHRDLVCGMNLALADGMLDGLGVRNLTARLESEPGRCCVVLEPAGPRGAVPPRQGPGA